MSEALVPKCGACALARERAWQFIESVRVWCVCVCTTLAPRVRVESGEW